MENQELKISHSPEIKDFVAALAKAQGTMKPAVFNRVNPHFKTRYADFTSCMDACRAPLSENGLAVIQYCTTIEGKFNLVTMLAHVSGQWMKSEFPLIATKLDSQGVGSAMTYAKRYSLCGMTGIVADEEQDDDGEGAMGRGKQEPQRNATVKNEPSKFVESLKTLQKLNPAQLQAIRTIEQKLDADCTLKLTNWWKKQYNVEKMEDIISEYFPKILEAYENGLKFMEQNSKELAHA